MKTPAYLLNEESHDFLTGVALRQHPGQTTRCLFAMDAFYVTDAFYVMEVFYVEHFLV